MMLIKQVYQIEAKRMRTLLFAQFRIQIEYKSKRELICCWSQGLDWNNFKFLRSFRLNKKSVPCNQGKVDILFSTEIETLGRESYFTHRRIHCLHMSCPRTTFKGFIAKHYLFKAIISTFCCSIEPALHMTHDTSNSQEQGVRHVWSWSMFLRRWISG